MENFCKQSGSWRTRTARTVLVLALAATAQLTPLSPASASSPPPESPGCETYGCLYEHCDQRYGRDGSGGSSCAHGIAYERLPDGGPDNRRFVGVLWPGHYDPARRAMWDQVAYCESTWRWNYRGTFHGGVQFTASTWQAFGGGQYSQYAWQALPEQQIDIAERVAFHGHGSNPPQGRGAWPHCGHHLTAP
jgi:hypothetical protein